MGYLFGFYKVPWLDCKTFFYKIFYPLKREFGLRATVLQFFSFDHYLSNIVGLIYIAARIPEHDDADLWLLFGMQELVSEMEREVYDDGFSHEASTYYHRLVTEMFLSASSLIERISKKRKERLLKVNIKSHKIRPKLININK